MHLLLKKIGKRLKSAIKKSNSSQKKISEKFGWNESTVGRIIRGEVDPGFSKILKIAEYLHINLNWLASGQGEMFINQSQTSGPGYAAAEPDINHLFNRAALSVDEFDLLALKIIKEEQISTEELMAAVREVRRRRKPSLLPDSPSKKNGSDLPVAKLKGEK